MFFDFFKRKNDNWNSIVKGKQWELIGTTNPKLFRCLMKVYSLKDIGETINNRLEGWRLDGNDEIELFFGSKVKNYQKGDNGVLLVETLHSKYYFKEKEIVA